MPKPRSRAFAVVALLCVVPIPTIGVLFAMVMDPGGAMGMGAFLLAKTWVTVFPVAWHILVEESRPGWSPARRGGLLAGAVLGSLMGAVIVLLYVTAGRVLIDTDVMSDILRQARLDPPRTYIAAACYWIAVNSLLEEYVWRWFITRQCEKLMPSAAAILASAAGFTLHHVAAVQAYAGWPVALIAASGTFCGAAIWSWCYVRFSSIWPGYISHVIADVAVLTIGYQILFGG